MSEVEGSVSSTAICDPEPSITTSSKSRWWPQYVHVGDERPHWCGPSGWRVAFRKS